MDLEYGTVKLTHTKGKKDHTVPLNAEVVDALRRLQAMTLQDGGPFVSMADNVNRAWSRIRKTAGVEDVTIHDLRRTATTRLFEAGTAPKTVQELLGHANLATTLRHYTKVTEEAKRDAVAKLRRTGGA